MAWEVTQKLGYWFVLFSFVFFPQRTQIWFPASAWWTVCNSNSRDSCGLSGIHRHCMYMAHRLTCRQNTHTHNIFKYWKIKKYIYEKKQSVWIFSNCRESCSHILPSQFFKPVKIIFIENNLFHIRYFDHNFSSLMSSQILPTHPTPRLLSLSLWNKQTNKPKEKIRHKSMHTQTHTSYTKNKTHKNSKSETTVYKQKTSKIFFLMPKQSNVGQQIKSTIAFVLCWRSPAMYWA